MKKVSFQIKNQLCVLERSNKVDIDKLKTVADTYCDLYRLGKISREEAKEHIMPYLDYVNEKSKELAKKYNQKHKEITFSYYLRAK